MEWLSIGLLEADSVQYFSHRAYAPVLGGCGGFPYFGLAIVGGIEYDAPVELNRHSRVQYGY